jgi:hypothetical protein
MDHKGNAETLKSLANRCAISLAETEVDHRCRESGVIAHVQSSFDVACGDNLRSGRAQSRLQIERDKKLVLDNENKSPGKWRGLHHDPERATRRGLLA